MPIVLPESVMGAVTEMFDCLAANNVVRVAVLVYADRSIPTVLPESVTGAVTLIKFCFVDRSTSKVLFARLKGLDTVKLSIFPARPEFTKAWVA